MKHALIVYNPISGSNAWQNIPQLAENVLKKHDFRVTWFETVAQKHQPLEQFLKKRFDLIVVIGGDGTVADVASFLIENKIKTPLGIVGRGSANLLARTLKIPVFNTQKALTFALTHEARPLDAIRVNRRHYGLIATGVGYDVLLMKNTHRGLKRRLGFLAYVLTFLKTFFLYRGHPYHLTLDGTRHRIVAKTILVLNLLPFSEHPAARRWLPEKLDPTDGHLNVIALNPRTLWNLLSRKPKIRTFTAQHLSVKGKHREFEIDGDVVRGRTLQIEVVSKALNVVY